MSIRRRLHTIAATALLSQPLLASATNGYFAHGYGMQSLGMAGTAIALPQDSLAAASNPAGTGLVGHRLDLGLSYFAPRRAARIEGNAFGPDDNFNGDGRRSFYIPEMGFTRPLNAQWGVGLALYGNGGMNTS
jgi:long-chain fatty acid transport protein